MNKSDFKKPFPPRHECPRCKYAFNGKILSLHEKNKTMRFENPREKPIDAVSVDKCWIPQAKDGACDYLILDWEKRLYLVELKGEDYLKACKQIKSTLEALVPTTCEPIPCFIIASRITHNAQAAAQHVKKTISNKWSGVDIKSHTRQYTCPFPA